MKRAIVLSMLLLSACSGGPETSVDDGGEDAPLGVPGPDSGKKKDAALDAPAPVDDAGTPQDASVSDTSTDDVTDAGSTNACVADAVEGDANGCSYIQQYGPPCGQKYYGDGGPVPDLTSYTSRWQCVPGYSTPPSCCYWVGQSQTANPTEFYCCP